MTLKSILISLFLLTVQIANGQEVVNWPEYFQLIHKADSLFSRRKYLQSARAYSSAFNFNRQHYSSGDRYNAAKAWAMAGQVDSAFYNLQKEAEETQFSDLTGFEKEPAFINLHAFSNWKQIAATVTFNQQEESLKLGKLKTVKAELEKILQSDQQYRQQINSVISKYGPGSAEANQLFGKMHETDSINSNYVCGVIDKYGWPAYDTVGFNANAAVFLVIQHSDSAIQAKYLPVMQQAVKQGKAIGGHLALLEDRVLIRQGKKQTYGSQVRCDPDGKNCQVNPIEDETHVDQRRAEVGLSPLAEYLKTFNIVYRKPE